MLLLPQDGGLYAGGGGVVYVHVDAAGLGHLCFLATVAQVARNSRQAPARAQQTITSWDMGARLFKQEH